MFELLNWIEMRFKSDQQRPGPFTGEQSGGVSNNLLTLTPEYTHGNLCDN